MKAAPLHPSENERLRSLRSLDLLDTPPEERFDRITRLACRALDVRYSAINLVDEDRQWGKSTCGIEQTEAPREQSFCAHAILESSTMIVEDTHEDERFQGHPLVEEEPYVRFYIGQPVLSADGQPVGTLCAFDTEPRGDAETLVDPLVDLAGIVESELQREHLHDANATLQSKLSEAQRRSRTDLLTQLWNRRAIMEIVESERERAQEEKDPIGITMMDIDDFKTINDTHGHPAGDEVIRTVAEKIRQATRDFDAVERFGGEEFLAVLSESRDSEALVVAKRIRNTIEEAKITWEGSDLAVTASFGLTVDKPPDLSSRDELLQSADDALYEAKKSGKNCVKTV